MNKPDASDSTPALPTTSPVETAARPPVLPPPLSVPGRDRKSTSKGLIIAISVAGVAALLVCIVAMLLLAGAVAGVGREAKAAPAPRAQTAAKTSSIAEQRVPGSEPGVSYTNDTRPAVPWSIHVLKIDRSRKDFTFHAGLAKDKILGVSFIADQARSVPRELGKAVAGVNGDFYVRDNPTYAGDPRGLQIVNGELVSAPSTVCVWFDADANPHLEDVKGDFHVTWPGGRKTPFGLNQQRQSQMIVLYTPTYGDSTRVSGGRDLVLEKDGDGPWLPLQASQVYRARVREVLTAGNTRLKAGAMVLSVAPDLLAGLPETAPGTVLEISTATTPDLKGVKTAIAGGPELIRNGQAFSVKTAPPGVSRNYSERSKYERHPRSAVGWSPTHIYFVTVDGRQPGLSMGIKLAELAEYMAGLGCTEAMNFDGGKSAQLWLSDKIMNSPCEGEDTVANSLLLVRKPGGR